jgi:hypothetical protein
MGMMDIIDAIIQQESGGNPRSLNPRTGAMGLMQVMPDTARNPGFGVKPLADPWTPAENRRFGTDYFNAMVKRYPGDRDAALAAYNWGPGNADKWVASGKTRPLPPETRNYIDSINAMTGGGRPPAALSRAQAAGGPAMDDPFADYWGTPTPPLPTRTGMSIGAGRGPQTVPPRPMPPQAGSMGTMADNLPQFLGGSDRPGYFGRVMQDPTFLTGASVLSGGLAGQDFGTSLARGTQAAQAAGQMHEAQRKRAAWARIFGPDGPDMNAPLLKGLPPDIIPVVQAMGPDDGMEALMKLRFKLMEPRQLTKVGPGEALYDERGGREVFRMEDKAPAGYRSAGDGSLEAIPGGPATQLAGDQAGRVALMRQARDGLTQAKKVYGGDMGISGRFAHTYGFGETGEARRTVTSAIEATLRALTGAAATSSEVARLEGLFAPNNFDGPKTRLDKLDKLEAFIDDAEASIMQGRGAAPPRQKTPAPDNDDPLGILD